MPKAPSSARRSRMMCSPTALLKLVTALAVFWIQSVTRKSVLVESVEL
ncbi:hypothetical protein ACVWXM_005571 [Bradyrhizobium sp. GM7.3]